MMVTLSKMLTLTNFEYIETSCIRIS